MMIITRTKNFFSLMSSRPLSGPPERVQLGYLELQAIA